MQPGGEHMEGERREGDSRLGVLGAAQEVSPRLLVGTGLHPEQGLSGLGPKLHSQ